jgi:hypothetical protein
MILGSCCRLTLLPLCQTRTVVGSTRLSFGLRTGINFLWRTAIGCALWLLLYRRPYFMLDQSLALFALFSLSSFISRCSVIGLIKLKLRLLALEANFVMNFVLLRMSTAAIG